MTLRDDLDLANVLRVVVEPTVHQLLRPGELDWLRLAWQPVPMPHRYPPRLPGGNAYQSVLTISESTLEPRRDEGWTTETRLLVELQAKGEQFTHYLASADDALADVNLEWHADEFCSRLQDFIAESRFGWGQLREGHSG